MDCIQLLDDMDMKWTLEATYMFFAADLFRKKDYRMIFAADLFRKNDYRMTFMALRRSDVRLKWLQRLYASKHPLE